MVTILLTGSARATVIKTFAYEGIKALPHWNKRDDRGLGGSNRRSQEARTHSRSKAQDKPYFKTA